MLEVHTRTRRPSCDYFREFYVLWARFCVKNTSRSGNHPRKFPLTTGDCLQKRIVPILGTPNIIFWHIYTVLVGKKGEVCNTSSSHHRLVQVSLLKYTVPYWEHRRAGTSSKVPTGSHWVPALQHWRIEKNGCGLGRKGGQLLRRSYSWVQ